MDLMSMVTGLNLVLCLAIAIVGYLAYKKGKGMMPIYIALAFLLFGVSHVMTLTGMAEQLSAVLIAVRILAYATVLYAIYKSFAEKKK